MTTGAYFNAGLVFPQDRFRPWNPFATGCTTPANRAREFHSVFRLGERSGSRGPVQVQFEGCGVHRLFTIGGRNDAPVCSLAHPDFASAPASGYVIFRIPTP